MNPDSLYYGSSGTVPLNSSAQVQFHNVYRMQPGSWQSAPHTVSDLSCMSNNSDTPCLEQPLVTPVSTAMYGTTSTCSWAHTVPSLMPWTKGEVVRFSAHPDPCTSQAATHYELSQNSTPHHLKRKSLEGTEDTPHKMCITEEKMAARFRDMHISNQFTVPSESPAPVNKSPTNLQQLEIMLQESDRSESGKSLILAPEIKKLVEPEKILNTFLNKIEKPSMALVVWQPPNNKLLEERGEQKDATKHNNNNLTPQQLSMMCHQYLSSQESQSDSSQALPEDVMEL